MSEGHTDRLESALDGHHRVERLDPQRDTLEASFEAEGPSLVVIPIDYSENQKLTEHLGTVSLPI